MELTLESALSQEGMLGHASYALLILSMTMRRMVLLRLLVILSAIVGISYDAFVLHDPVGMFWETLLVGVNLVQLAITAWQNRRARFSHEEQALIDSYFPGLGPGRRRALLDLGTWRDAPAGDTLCHEGKPVAALAYIASGTASVAVGGHEVAVCGPGALIGEITVASGAPASGTVTTLGPSRVWQIPADTVREVIERRPELGYALEACFFRAVREKLLRGNAERVAWREAAASG